MQTMIELYRKIMAMECPVSDPRLSSEPGPKLLRGLSDLLRPGQSQAAEMRWRHCDNSAVME